MDEMDVGTKIVDVGTGESLVFTGPASITILAKSGRAARLQVTARKDVQITRIDSCQPRTSATILTSSAKT
jgi:hypothetical protein